MAGFAIFIAIVTFAFVGLVAARVMAIILYFVARGRVSRGVSSRKAKFVAVVAPFLGLLWIAVAFLIPRQDFECTSASGLGVKR